MHIFFRGGKCAIFRCFSGPKKLKNFFFEKNIFVKTPGETGFFSRKNSRGGTPSTFGEFLSKKWRKMALFSPPKFRDFSKNFYFFNFCKSRFQDAFYLYFFTKKRKIFKKNIKKRAFFRKSKKIKKNFVFFYKNAFWGCVSCAKFRVK